MKRSALLFHHFFHPDDVVSARHFGDLATGLHQRGWDVTVLTSNRYCRREPGARITPPTEMWEGVRIVRSARPGLNQSKSLSRLLNGFFIGQFFIAESGLVPDFTVPSRFLPLPLFFAFLLALLLTMTGSLYNTWRFATSAPAEAIR